MRDRRRGRVYLPDRGSRRQCNRDAKGNTECHKDEFRAHGVASHFHLHPAGIWAAGAAIQTPGRNATNEQDRVPGELFPPPTQAIENTAFHLNGA